MQEAARSTRIALLILLLSSLLGGCSFIGSPGYNPPGVELLGIQLERARLNKQRFRIRVQLENRSQLPLPLHALDYRLFLDGKLLGEGHAEPDLLLGAHDSKTLTLPLHTRLMQSLGTLRQLHKSRKAIAWRIEASLHTARFFGPTLQFQREGEYTPRKSRP